MLPAASGVKKCSVFDPGVSYLLPETMELWQDNLSACKQDKTLKFFKVLDRVVIL